MTRRSESLPQGLTFCGQTDRKQMHTEIYPAVTGMVIATRKNKAETWEGDWERQPVSSA